MTVVVWAAKAGIALTQLLAEGVAPPDEHSVCYIAGAPLPRDMDLRQPPLVRRAVVRSVLPR